MDGAAPAPHPDLAGRDRRPVFSGKRGFHLRCHHRACRHRRGAPGSSAMSKALRIGLIGAGWVTQYHLQGWQKLAGNASVVAITDPSAENAAARANEFGIEQRFASADEMLAQCDLDAVDIAAPRAVHAELVRLAADPGLAGVW